MMVVETAERTVTPASKDASRNAWIRRVTEKHLKKGMEIFHERFPDVDPDHLTRTGTVLVSAGVILLEHQNRTGRKTKKGRALGVGLIFAGALLDGADGALARVIKAEGRIVRDAEKAELRDMWHDRVQEGFAASQRLITQHQRGNTFGRVAAVASAWTTTVPSLVRARVEQGGRIVPEHGGNPVDALGTRIARVGFMITNSLFPEAQPVLDSIAAAANLNTSRTRWQARNGDIVLDEERRRRAQKRVEFLAKVESGIVGTIFLLDRHLSKKYSSKKRKA